MAENSSNAATVAAVPQTNNSTTPAKKPRTAAAASGNSNAAINPNDAIKTSRIRVLAFRGGVLTLGADGYSFVRNAIVAEIDRVVEKAVANCGFARRRRVAAEPDLTGAFEQLRINYVSNGKEESIETCKLYESGTPADKQQPAPSGPGSRAERSKRMIAYYQSLTDCLILHKYPFQALVLERSRRFMPDVKWAQRALCMLQVYMEAYVTRLFQHAVSFQQYRSPKRTVLQVLDLQQALKVLAGPNAALQTPTVSLSGSMLSSTPATSTASAATTAQLRATAARRRR